MFAGCILYYKNKSNYKKQRQDIILFARKNNISLGCIYSGFAFADIRKFAHLFYDGIITSDISNLGAPLSDIKSILQYCRDNDFCLFSAAENYAFFPNCLTDDFFKGFDALDKIRHDLISAATKKSLLQKKAAGIKLGRNKGRVFPKRLDDKKNEIAELLRKKSTKTEIAKKLKVSRSTLYNFLKTNYLI